MEKLPTPDEFLKDNKYPPYTENGGLGTHYVKDAMILFAKLHVEAALKEASEKAKTKEDIAIFAEGTFETQIVDKDSILNAYPLTNIK